MGRFCKFCGRQLTEGQECTCSDAVRIRGEVEEMSAQGLNAAMQQLPTMNDIPNNMNYNANINSIPNYNNANQNTYNSSLNQYQETFSNQQYATQSQQQYNIPNRQYDTQNQQQYNIPNQQYDAQNQQQYNIPNQQYNTQNQPHNDANPFYNNMQSPKSAVSGTNPFENVLKICKSFFINPVEGMKKEFNEPDKTAQFLTGGMAAILMWLILFFILKKGIVYVSSTTILGKTFVFILMYISVRFLYIGGLYLFNHGKNPNLSYKDLAGLASVSFILDAVMFFVLLIIQLLDLHEFFMLGIILLFISTIVGSFTIAHLAGNEDFEKTYRITLILQIIIMVLIFIIMIIAKKPIARFFFGAFSILPF